MTATGYAIFADNAPLYWAAGLNVMPLRIREKKAFLPEWQRFADQLSTEAERNEWLEKYALNNIGLPAGPASNIVFVDLDDPATQALIEPAIPSSPWKRVGQKGCIYAYRFNGVRSFKIFREGAAKPSVEFIASGGQAVMPPSIHPDTGQPYTANVPLYEIARELPELPTNIEDILRTALTDGGFALTGGKRERERERVTYEDGRYNIDMTRTAGALRRIGLDEEAIAAALAAIDVNLPNSRGPEELSRVAQSVANYEPALTLGFTDQELANGFAQLAEGRIKRVKQGGWAEYVDGRWAMDESGKSALAAQEMVKEFTARLRAQAEAKAQTMSRDDGDRLIAAAKKCQSASAIAHIQTLAASDDRIKVSYLDFDADRDWLNTKNKVLKLSTGEFLDHDPNLLLMRQCGVAYNPNATCPRFDRFLDEILEPDVAEFLMRAFAYAMFGKVNLDTLFILIGGGSNGKTTLINTIQAVLGNYATIINPESLLRKQGEHINNDIAGLKGPRLIFTSEFAEGAVVDASLIKRLTGREMMKARFLYKENFEFKNTGVFFLTTNPPPVLNTGDAAIRRRVCMIRFSKKITNPDPNLESELSGEAPGIFNKLLRALHEFRASGECLIRPRAVEDATGSYIIEFDLVERFIEEHCVRDHNASVRPTPLYRRFKRYLEDNGYGPISQGVFSRALKEKDFVQSTTKQNGYFPWLGLRLIPDPELAATVAEAAQQRREAAT